MTIKHYLLLILAVSAVAFMPALVWFVGALTLVGGAVGFVFSDLSREKQEAWELTLARTLQRMTTFLKKPVQPGADASGVTVDVPAPAPYPVSPHPAPPYPPPHQTPPIHHNLSVAIPGQVWPSHPAFDTPQVVAQTSAPPPPILGASAGGMESAERKSRLRTRLTPEATLDTAYPETDLARRRLRPAPPLTPPPTKRR